MPDRWQQVQELFGAALAHSVEERGSFLAEACGDDDELRAEVESLLEHDERASDEFLKPPEPGPDVRPPDGPDPLIGATVGRYHVKGVIAVGGMGTVYEAVQEQPHRVVALKVMKRNVASRSALRRFQFESQVLARLRHPNVAQVFEAGTHTPEPRDSSRAVPYFAMEYIPGARSITDYAIDKNLTTRDRLAMFAKACDAVHHGHQKGIIHRDLKPANILVDSQGEPKVIDFGVARATDSDLAITTQQTNIGQLVGTMQYMSPEQCDADPHDLDTRTDVYSLGVVLFELLTGELPYEASGTTIYQATVAIREQAPRSLSAINPKLRGDVEIIALKALAKERERRYQSAAALASDIRRHLNREPIEARPPTAWTRAVRWVGRHPVFATNTAWVGTIALLAATAGVSLFVLRTRPYEVRRSPDESKAQLLSVGGTPLHTWSGGAARAITFGELVDRPEELGGGSLALLGFHFAQAQPFPRSLCAFEAGGDLKRPVWRGRIESGDIPAELRTKGGFVGEQFAVHIGAVFDVFPKHPGHEIVAVHGCVHSPRAICIYDLAGNLLYQVWHDGSLNSVYWMSDAGLLVFTGLNSEVDWDERGYPEVQNPHPVVVFAIRPALGFVRPEFLRSEQGGGPLDAAWYKCLHPPDARDRSDNAWSLGPPLDGRDAGQFVCLSLKVNDKLGAGVWWTVNQYGDVVKGSQRKNDSYRRNQRLLPGHPDRLADPDYFKLGPLPPVVPESRETE